MKRNLKGAVLSISIFLLVVLILTTPLSIQATDGPTNESVATADEVLVVYNADYTTDQNSNGTQDSLEIAEYYQDARGIPADNVVGVNTGNTGDDITMSRTEYNNTIKTPLENYIDATFDARDDIKYIVFTKGIPFRIEWDEAGGSFGDPKDGAAVDADTCYLFQTYTLTGTRPNPYYSLDSEFELNHRFKSFHYKRDGDYPTLSYLVTRLDASNTVDVLSMIDRAVDPASIRSAELSWVGDGRGSSYMRYDQTEEVVTNFGRTFDGDGDVGGGTNVYTTTYPVIGFLGLGLNDYTSQPFTSNEYSDYIWANGGVMGSSYDSASATSYSGPVYDAIAGGASASVGTVYEPLTTAVPLADIWMPLYFSGYTFADAIYQSMIYTSWQNLVIGDPLMRLAGDPLGRITNVATSTPASGQYLISWNNPSSSDPGLSSVYVATSTSAYDYSVATTSMTNLGLVETYTDTNPTPGTYYTIFPYYENGLVGPATEVGYLPDVINIQSSMTLPAPDGATTTPSVLFYTSDPVVETVSFDYSISNTISDIFDFGIFGATSITSSITNGIEYTVTASGTATLPFGETSGTISDMVLSATTTALFDLPDTLVVNFNNSDIPDGTDEKYGLLKLNISSLTSGYSIDNDLRYSDGAFQSVYDIIEVKTPTTTIAFSESVSSSTKGSEASDSFVFESTHIFPPTNGGIDIDYTVGGTAVSGTHYSGLSSGTETLSPGELTTDAISFTLLDNNTWEVPQTITVTLDSLDTNTGSFMAGEYPSENEDSVIYFETGTPTTFTHTIYSPLAATFTSTTGSVANTESSASIPLTLSTETTEDITVTVSASGGTAVEGDDYSLATTTATFSAGETTATLPVTITSGATPNTTIEFSMDIPSGSYLQTADSNTYILTITQGDTGTISGGYFRNTSSNQVRDPEITQSDSAQDIRLLLFKILSQITGLTQIVQNLEDTSQKTFLTNQLADLLFVTQNLIQQTSMSDSTQSYFIRDLDTDFVGEDVRQLQVFLNQNGFTLAQSGPGSPGEETNIFGTLTQQALIQFQRANNIFPAKGYFGPITRGVVNKML